MPRWWRTVSGRLSSVSSTGHRQLIENMNSSDSEGDQSDVEEFSDADDVPPDEDEVSNSSEDLEEADVDELLNENIEIADKKKYEAKNGLVWQSVSNYPLPSFHSLRPPHEKVTIDLPRGVPTKSESSYFGLFFTDRMLDRSEYSVLSNTVHHFFRIVEHTNAHAWRADVNFPQITLMEMKAVIGLLFHMAARGCGGMPVNHVWSANPAFGLNCESEIHLGLNTSLIRL